MFKKIISLVAIFVFMMLYSNVIAFAERTVDLDTSNIEKGIIKILYENPDVTKAKLMVEHDGEKNYTNLSNISRYERFSLTMGNGEYTVAIYENVTGTKYRKVFEDKVILNSQDEEKIPEAKVDENATEKTEVSIPSKVVNTEVSDTTSNDSVYLQSSREINYENSITAVKLAKDLTKDAKTDEEKAKIIYNYIVKNYDYDYNKIKTLSNGYIPDMDKVLADGKGICYDFSVLYAGMLRSVGVEAKLIKGYSAVTPVYHAWNEVKINGEWVIVDTTFDQFAYENGYDYNYEKEAQYYNAVRVY